MSHSALMKLAAASGLAVVPYGAKSRPRVLNQGDIGGR